EGVALVRKPWGVGDGGGGRTVEVREMADLVGDGPSRAGRRLPPLLRAERGHDDVERGLLRLQIGGQAAHVDGHAHSPSVAHDGGRFARKAAIPSAASSDPNKAADCAAVTDHASSAARSGTSFTRALARPRAVGPPSRMSATTSASSPSSASAGTARL